MPANNRDWDRDDIKYALAKAGLTLASLARKNGLQPSTISNVFRNKYSRIENIISDALGVPVEKIWPSRYIKPGSKITIRSNDK